MNVYFISDTHFFHENIMKFKQRTFDNISIHNEYLVEQWNSVVRKNSDVVFHLGDVCMSKTPNDLSIMDKLQGRKILIKGNHDTYPILHYLHYFEEVHGLLGYKEFWLSHCPIHPMEMYRRKCNIHGHSHYVERAQYGNKYINVNCDANIIEDFKPINLDNIRDILLDNEHEA